MYTEDNDEPGLSRLGMDELRERWRKGGMDRLRQREGGREG